MRWRDPCGFSTLPVRISLSPSLSFLSLLSLSFSFSLSLSLSFSLSLSVSLAAHFPSPLPIASDYTQWMWTALDLAPPGFQPIPLAGSGLVYINSLASLTSVGGTTNGTVDSVDYLYRFHALGLLPPLQSNTSYVPNGWDFNLATNTTSVFGSLNPSFNVLPHGNNNNTGTPVVTSSFGTLMEVTPSGEQVTVFDLSSSNGFILLYDYFNPQLGVKVTVFTRHAVPGADGGNYSALGAVSVRLEFYQYINNTAAEVVPPESTLNPFQFIIGAGYLKFNLRVQNWPFAQPQNNLILTMGFAFPSPVDLTSAAASFGSSFTFTCLQGSITLNVVGQSVNDFDTYQPVLTNIVPSPSNTSANLQFTFNSFTSDLYYDPSLGVLLNPGGGSTTGLTTSNNDGSSSNNDAIYIGVFVSVGVVAIVLVVVFIVVGVLWYTQRKRVSTFVRRATIQAGSESGRPVGFDVPNGGSAINFE